MIKKTCVIYLILTLLSNRVIAQSEHSVLINDLRDAHLEAGQLIKLRKSDDKLIYMRFIGKTESYLSGYAAEKNNGTILTTSEEIKIRFDEIRKYEIIDESRRGGKIFFSVLVIVVLAISYSLSDHEDWNF